MTHVTRPAQDPRVVPAHDGEPHDARGRLVAAAVAAFASQGFHGTSTRDIAFAAGMSPAAVYIHYRSKEDLLYEISRQGHEQTLRHVQEGIASSDDPVEQLDAVVRAFIMHHAQEHTSARIVNYELAALKPEHLREITVIRRTIEGLIRQVIKAGASSGVFTTRNPHMTAVALLSLGIDVARWYSDGGGWSPEDIADYYCEIAARIVGLPGAIPGNEKV